MGNAVLLANGAGAVAVHSFSSLSLFRRGRVCHQGTAARPRPRRTIRRRCRYFGTAVTVRPKFFAFAASTVTLIWS